MPHDAAHCFHIKMLREKEGLIPVWRYHRMARTSECGAADQLNARDFILTKLRSRVDAPNSIDIAIQ
jgi:hypothetical protein